MNITFIRSEPISAIFVNIPPAILKTDAPNDSPMAKPMKLAPARLPGSTIKINNIIVNSKLINIIPMLIPACIGILKSLKGLFSKLANAIREFAKVFILIPNQATE
ncbi:MAG: hypothetical protein BWX61_00764 [Bacteroidetes bacterium ADurb.Bin035]|nr:MAG: hypothetical protein BWX61_00764 [Bacteroidetes bacterium ADurb.Bin035]